MKKFILLLLIISSITLPAQAQQGIDFVKAEKRPILLLNRESPEVYKPTRLIIGQENKVLIKAEPGSCISLAYSESNTGAAPLYGQKLRLGSDLKTTEGIVPQNGLLELSIMLPDNKEFEGKTFYIEVAVWKNKDFSDIQLAKIVAPSGRETSSNSIVAALPPKNANKPTFTPTLPGAPLEMMQTMKFIEDMKQNKDSKDETDIDYDAQSSYRTPVIIRNLNAPELNQK